MGGHNKWAIARSVEIGSTETRDRQLKIIDWQPIFEKRNKTYLFSQ